MAVFDHQRRDEHAAEPMADHAGTPGKATLTDRLAAQPSPLARAEYISETAQRDAHETLSTLVPAYIAARDALDQEAVEQVGTRLIVAVIAVHGAQRALEAITATIRRVPSNGAAICRGRAGAGHQRRKLAGCDPREGADPRDAGPRG
jgi:hypothetical protein